MVAVISALAVWASLLGVPGVGWTTLVGFMYLVWTREMAFGAENLSHGKYLPTLVWFSWCAAPWVAKLWRVSTRTAFGDLASGLIAACYVLAGIAKLKAHGIAWGGGLAILILERSINPTMFSGIRRSFAESPLICTGFGLVALALELGAFGLLVPKLRRPLLFCLASMHLSIGVLLGYFYPDWCLVLLAVGLRHSEGAPVQEL